MEHSVDIILYATINYYSAGEKEYEIRLARHAGVPINESVQKEFIAVRDELGLNYKFPFED